MTSSYPEEQRKIDEMYMERALSLAARGRGTTTPNPMVGAVIRQGTAGDRRRLSYSGRRRPCGGQCFQKCGGKRGRCDRGNHVCDAGAMFPLWKDTAMCG